MPLKLPMNPRNRRNKPMNDNDDGDWNEPPSPNEGKAIACILGLWIIGIVYIMYLSIRCWFVAQ